MFPGRLSAIHTENRCRAKPDRPIGRSPTDRDCAEYHNRIEMIDLSRRGLLKLSTGALTTDGLPATRRGTGMMVTSSETPSPASSWNYRRTPVRRSPVWPPNDRAVGGPRSLHPSSVCQHPTAREYPARQNETGWWAYLPPMDRLPSGLSDVFQRGGRRGSASLGARVQITDQEVASA